MAKDKELKTDTANNKQPVKKITPERVKDFMLSYEMTVDPAAVLKVAADLLNQLDDVEASEKKELQGKVNKSLAHAAAIISLDTHHLMAETVDKEKLRTFLIEVTDQLVKQYDCKTTAEKMLAQTAGWAYTQMIEYADKLNGLTRQEYLSNERTGYYSMLSKEVDRCYRRYITALTTLKHFKQPALSVTFKANNAFVAQNQQINAEGKSEIKDKKQ